MFASFAPFWLNNASLPRPVRESSSDDSLEELQNPPKEESPKLSFESLYYSLELELQVSAII